VSHALPTKSAMERTNIVHQTIAFNVFPTESALLELALKIDALNVMAKYLALLVRFVLTMNVLFTILAEHAFHQNFVILRPRLASIASITRNVEPHRNARMESAFQFVETVKDLLLIAIQIPSTVLDVWATMNAIQDTSAIKISVSLIARSA